MPMHLLTPAPKRWLAVTIHFSVLADTVFMLPLSIAQGWGKTASFGTALWLLGLFTVSVGLPSLHSPRTVHCCRLGSCAPAIARQRPLFCLRRIQVRSFLALLSFPPLLEPAFTLHAQGCSRAPAFCCWCALIAGCAVLLLRSSRTRTLRLDSRCRRRAELADDRPVGLRRHGALRPACRRHRACFNRSRPRHHCYG